jgi:hypothetical protein
MRPALLALGLLAACTPPTSDLVVREPRDLSYALGDVWRVDGDTCADADVDTYMYGGVTFENRYPTITVALALVDEACAETPLGTIAAGEDLVTGGPQHGVIRVYSPDDELLSAWEIAFVTEGLTVVLQ